MERTLHACVTSLVRIAWKVPADERVEVGELIGLGGSARSRVWRVVALRNEGQRSRSFIVKSPEDAAGQFTDRQGRLANEFAALTFLESVLPERTRSMAPRLLAEDLTVGVLLLEDLSPIKGGLEQLLMGHIRVQGGSAASVLKLAHVLGTMHGRCSGRCEKYLSVRASSNLKTKPAPDSASVAMLADVAVRLVPKPFDRVGFVAEMESAFKSSFAETGDFSTLIHGDLCPTNTVVLNKAGDVALLDFEFARPGNALMDACVFRLGFPTSHYAGQLPRDLVREAEQVYRKQAAASGMVAASDRGPWREAMGQCCALWTWGFLRASIERKVLEVDSPMGKHVLASRRQILMFRLRVTVKVLRKHPGMRVVFETTQSVLDELVRLWGHQDDNATLYLGK